MRRFRKWILILFGVVLTLVLLRVFLFSSFYISSSGMSNLLKEGDRVLVTKYSYGLSIPFSPKQIDIKRPQYQDFVFIQNPLSYPTSFNKENVAYMGQIVGLPGDTLIINKYFQLVSNTFRPLNKQAYLIDNNNIRYVDSISNIHNIPTNNTKTDSLHVYRALNGYEAYILTSMDADIVPLDNATQNVEFSLIVPKQGHSVDITPWNKSLIYNAILFHEQETNLLYRNDTIFLNGVLLDSYTFKQDYYWISVLDAQNTADSSTYGFVPKKNIIGKGRFIWFSKQPQTPFYNGYNWNRFFKSITQ